MKLDTSNLVHRLTVAWWWQTGSVTLLTDWLWRHGDSLGVNNCLEYSSPKWCIKVLSCVHIFKLPKIPTPAIPGSRGYRVFSPAFSLCLFFRTVSKNDAARITKLGVQMFHHESWETHLFWDQCHESQNQCRRGSLHSCECWLLAVVSVPMSLRCAEKIGLGSSQLEKLALRATEKIYGKPDGSELRRLKWATSVYIMSPVVDGGWANSAFHPFKADKWLVSPRW